MKWRRTNWSLRGRVGWVFLGWAILTLCIALPVWGLATSDINTVAGWANILALPLTGLGVLLVLAGRSSTQESTSSYSVGSISTPEKKRSINAQISSSETSTSANAGAEFPQQILELSDLTWIAAIYLSEEDSTPAGVGVAIDERRVLTSDVTIRDSLRNQPSLWIDFPMADNPNLGRREVSNVRRPQKAMAEVAILQFDDALPSDVHPAPLRCPHPTSMINRAWWAFGFPPMNPRGRTANGIIREPLAYGWLRLDGDTNRLAEAGFAGAGLWCPDYEAIIAIVLMEK